MASPVLVPLVANTWTLVATAVTNADLHLKRLSANCGYAWTYVNTGGAAPTDDTEAIPIRDKFLRVDITPAVDVYVICTHAGIVRVDVGAGTINATLVAGDTEIGAVELKNAVTDDRAEISDANTARAATTHVISMQHIDAAGKVLPAGDNKARKIMVAITDGTTNAAVIAGTAALKTDLSSIAGIATDVNSGNKGNGTLRTVIASDDLHFGAVGAASDVDGVLHGQLRYIGEAVDDIPAKGTAAMAASLPVTLATNDTHLGQVGAASDVDGNIHGQLRYIGESISAVLPVTPVYFFDADGDNTAQVLKNAAGVLYKITAVNPNAAEAYVQLFNTAAGGVTPGVTAPVYVVYVPAGGAVIDDYTFGLGFSTAITYVCATTPTGSGDPAIGLTLSAVFK